MKLINIDKKNYEIVVIGMGYVGLTYSLHLNTLGYTVIGLEKNSHLINSINNKVLPFYEEDLESKLSSFISKKLLRVVNYDDYLSNITNTPKIYIVTVGTPIIDKKLNIKPMDEVFQFLYKYLNENDCISLRSTVAIGLTTKYCNKFDFNIRYSFAPERTIEGKAIKELSTLPQVFGANDSDSKLFFNKFFKMTSAEVVELSSSDAAEMVKLSSNVYRDVIFGFSNELSVIAHNNGIKIKEVIDACNYKYPRCDIYSSGPVSGPCLSKDSYILGESIDYKNHDSIILSSRNLNEKYAIDIIEKNIIDKKNACILGLSFKGCPPTSDTRDSYAIKIFEFLNKNKIAVSAYDPMVFDEDFKKIGIERENSLEDAFNKKDLIIIQNNNYIFKRMNIKKLINKCSKDVTIIDLWSLHIDKTFNETKYIAL
tara:strand:- start:12864 stop:14141 length:1278 start_codon:yes stop_codon:yes gene_type:complete